MTIVLTFNNVLGYPDPLPPDQLWSSEGVKMADDAYMSSLMSGLNAWPDPEVHTATAFETGTGGVSLLKFTGAFTYAVGGEIPLDTSTITSVIQYPGFGEYKYSITGLPNLAFDYDTFDIWTAFKSARDQGVHIVGYVTKDYLVGGAGNDTIDGGDSWDTIVGGDGNDVINGGNGGENLTGTLNHTSDELHGEGGNDTIYGGDNDAIDIIRGGEGDDYLDGGAPTGNLDAVMYGGPGDDTMVFHSDVDSSVQELANEGYDTAIWAPATSMSLLGGPNNVERLIVQSEAGQQVLGSGPSLTEIIGGNGGDNIIIGTSGTLRGGAGNDDLFGSSIGTPTNYLDGEAGADRMWGKYGNDTYVIDNVGDLINDNAGVDTVLSAITFTLPYSAGQFGPAANNWPTGLTTHAGYFERLTLTGASAINGKGNALNNTISGNSAANKLSGLGGADTLNGSGGVDTMAGGAGDDLFVVGSPGETVIENLGEGIDTVKAAASFVLPANVEHLVLVGSTPINGNGNALGNKLFGSATNNYLKGFDGADSIDGAAGSDVINGGVGKDLLKGGAGFDAFVFDVAPNSVNRDSILDFNVADDAIRLDNAVFTTIGTNGLLAASAFQWGTGGGAANAAVRIIYNSSSGKLFYDSDGSGAAVAVHFATLSTGLALTNADFGVI